MDPKTETVRPEVIPVQKPKKKEPPKPLDMKIIQQMIENGVRLKTAHFRVAVKSWTGDPEFQLYSMCSKNRPSRLANLWYTPQAIVIEQHGIWKILPPAAADDTIVL